jgi:hypothetical protein
MQEPQVRIAEIDTPEVGTTWQAPGSRALLAAAGEQQDIRPFFA